MDALKRLVGWDRPKYDKVPTTELVASAADGPHAEPSTALVSVVSGFACLLSGMCRAWLCTGMLLTLYNTHQHTTTVQSRRICASPCILYGS